MPIDKAVVLAIHGVGNPCKGEIAEALAKNLVEGAVVAKITEINWNTVVDQPINPKGDLVPSSLTTLTSDLANLEFVGSEVIETTGSPIAHHMCNVQEVAFSLGENCLSIAVASLAVLQPILAYFFVIALGSNAPPVLWLFPITLFKWALWGFVTSLAAFVLCGFALAIITRNAVPCNVAARRAGILLLRPFLLVIISPLLIPWRSSLRHMFRWTYGNARYGVGLVVIYVAIARLVFEVGLRQQLARTIGPLTMIFLKCYAVVLLTTLLVGVVGYGVKILLDIFRYAGEPSYRTRIQQFVSQTVNSSRAARGEGTHFVVIAHSLGSVIAVDSLLNSDSWLNSDRVTLVTMGSPLRRFFFRFFPNVFFPRNADVCAKTLSHRFAGFRWINCYRPFDQVGTRLGFTETSFTRDCSTKQFGRILTAHPDYWGDSKVRDDILVLYQEMDFSHAPEAPHFRAFGQTDGVVAKRFGRLIARSLLVAVSLSPIASIPLGIAGAWYRHRSSTAQLEKLQLHGVRTSASVGYWIENSGESLQDGTPILFPHFTFQFKDQQGRTRSRDYVVNGRYMYPYSEVRSRMDRDKLLDFIEQAGKRPSVANHEGELVVDGVGISYLPEDPTYVYVTQFPPRTGMFTDVFAAFYVLLFSFGPSLVGVPIFSMLARALLELAGGKYGFPIEITYLEDWDFRKLLRS